MTLAHSPLPLTRVSLRLLHDLHIVSRLWQVLAQRQRMPMHERVIRERSCSVPHQYLLARRLGYRTLYLPGAM